MPPAPALDRAGFDCPDRVGILRRRRLLHRDDFARAGDHELGGAELQDKRPAHIARPLRCCDRSRRDRPPTPEGLRPSVFAGRISQRPPAAEERSPAARDRKAEVIGLLRARAQSARHRSARRAGFVSPRRGRRDQRRQLPVGEFDPSGIAWRSQSPWAQRAHTCLPRRSDCFADRTRPNRVFRVTE
jgi:hypothetical protein